MQRRIDDLPSHIKQLEGKTNKFYRKNLSRQKGLSERKLDLIPDTRYVQSQTKLL